jgi:hypothetical protein
LKNKKRDPQDFKLLSNLSTKISISKNVLVARYPSPSMNDFLWGGDIT